jgi:hypothetical protein
MLTRVVAGALVIVLGFSVLAAVSDSVIATLVAGVALAGVWAAFTVGRARQAARRR